MWTNILRRNLVRKKGEGSEDGERKRTKEGEEEERNQGRRKDLKRWMGGGDQLEEGGDRQPGEEEEEEEQEERGGRSIIRTHRHRQTGEPRSLRRRHRTSRPARRETRAEKKRMAMAMRQKALGTLGMTVHLSTFLLSVCFISFSLTLFHLVVNAAQYLFTDFSICVFLSDK